MRPARWLVITALVLPAIAAELPARVGLDLGAVTSEVWAGFLRLTPEDRWTNGALAGWVDAPGLRAVVQRHAVPVENPARGRTEPPPMWTSPITEDALLGTEAATLRIAVAPGEYEVEVISGSSVSQHRAWVFDFDLAVGGATQRVIVAGIYEFRFTRLHAVAGPDGLEVRFLPRNRWIANAVVVWPAGDPAAERDMLAEVYEWTFGLPPHERERWREDPPPPPGEVEPLRPHERERGFRVWSRHWMEPVYPASEPRGEELDPEIRLFATPGELEPFTVVVRPLRDLERIEAEALGIGPVPAGRIELRSVRYMRARPNYSVFGSYRVVPDVLERWAPRSLRAGENLRLWATVHVPEDAPAGEHRGGIVIRAGGARAEVPVRLRVLPFRLREPKDRLYAIYYRHPLDLADAAPDAISRNYWRRKAELEHADIAAHGTRNVVLHVSASPADERGEFRIRWDLLGEKIELGRRHDFRGPLVVSFPVEAVYRRHTGRTYGSHLRGVERPPAAFAEEITAMVRAIEAGRRERGWPEFLYYPVDEPSTEPAAVEFMVTVLRACKAAGVRTYVTADPTADAFEPLRPWVDVWCYQAFNVPASRVHADRARGIEYWCYPNHVAGENDHTPVAGARMTYGFGFHRSGYRALIPWIYQANVGNPWNYLDGPYMDFMNRSEPDGTPTPVALWEAYREGWDDARYLATLQHLIDAARECGGPAAHRAADAAEAELQGVLDAVPALVRFKTEGLWDADEFDIHRWRIARRILKLIAAGVPPPR
ncbi:MAG: hypothetical protein N2652_02460 [Kiritimatiellae bacterium]|nr:hypothetical protein [Kiritimatiellia bacterium]